LFVVSCITAETFCSVMKSKRGAERIEGDCSEPLTANLPDGGIAPKIGAIIFNDCYERIREFTTESKKGRGVKVKSEEMREQRERSNYFSRIWIEIKDFNELGKFGDELLGRCVQEISYKLIRRGIQKGIPKWALSLGKKGEFREEENFEEFLSFCDEREGDLRDELILIGVGALFNNFSEGDSTLRPEEIKDEEESSLRAMGKFKEFVRRSERGAPFEILFGKSSYKDKEENLKLLDELVETSSKTRRLMAVREMEERERLTESEREEEKERDELRRKRDKARFIGRNICNGCGVPSFPGEGEFFREDGLRGCEKGLKLDWNTSCGGCRLWTYCGERCRRSGWAEHQEDCKRWRAKEFDSDFRITKRAAELAESETKFKDWMEAFENWRKVLKLERREALGSPGRENEPKNEGGVLAFVPHPTQLIAENLPFIQDRSAVQAPKTVNQGKRVIRESVGSRDLGMTSGLLKSYGHYLKRRFQDQAPRVANRGEKADPEFLSLGNTAVNFRSPWADERDEEEDQQILFSTSPWSTWDSSAE